MKYFITAALAIIVALSCPAQTNFAISAGYNHNTGRVHTKNIQQPTGYVPGYNVTARVKTAFEPPLNFVGLIAYNKRGYTLQPLMGDTINKEISIHYIDLAPILSYDLVSVNKNKLTLFAGPMLGMALSGKQKITEKGTPVNTTTSSPMKFSLTGYYGYVNAAIHSGISFQFNKIFIEGTYHLGLTSINNDEEVDRTNIKNRGFAINLGYWF